jgi:glucokinase
MNDAPTRADGGPILGLDVGGTKTAIILGDAAGRVLARHAMLSPLHLGPAGMVAQIVAEARRLLAAHSGPDPRAVGVAIGGPLDSDAGVILGPPHLPGWDQVPLRALLEAEFAAPVYVEHDARAGAIAEWRFGAGRRGPGVFINDLVFLTMGTGIGAGIITGGHILHHRSARTAETGHWRLAPDGPLMFGKRGAWESFCSGAGIAALAALRAPGRFHGITVAELAQLARRGDADAQAVFAESAERLGQGIALLCDLFAPDLVVLGALGVRLGNLLIPGARRVLDTEALPAVAARVRIVPAALGEQIGDVAALCAALARLEGWGR